MSTSHAAIVEKPYRNYAATMKNNDLEAILTNFADEATATSPLSRKQPAWDFYEYVLRVTSDRKMRLKTIFVGVSDPLRAAIHSACTRTAPVAGLQPSRSSMSLT